MDVSSVQESFARCTLKSGFIDRFYDVFLASHPGLAPMFAKTDMADQKGLLRKGISMVLLFSQGNAMATNALDRIGETHSPRGMDIKPNMYAFWKNSLMQVVREFDAKLTPDTDAQWNKVLDTGINHIVSKR
jgi:hemoglobin-like flavoprotein